MAAHVSQTLMCVHVWRVRVLFMCIIAYLNKAQQCRVELIVDRIRK